MNCSMRNSLFNIVLGCTLGATVLIPLVTSAQDMQTITRAELKNKIRGGMAGQMVGVVYGFPTEFKFLGELVEGEIAWQPDMVREALQQDDLYVEMTFAEVMDRIGLDATTEQYGDAFRDSKYPLFHANASARRLLNNGVKAPMSGHPKFNIHANDIDFQIEADFIGLMTPGMPQQSIEMCERVGHVMNYGDGVYGGSFISGMYSAAFFEKDIPKIVEAGIACMPKGSGYRAIIEDVIAEYGKNQDDWKACWKTINAKWDKHDSCVDGAFAPFNIDARLNGAYVAIGLLYGDGDFTKTIEIATRCGQDSDCNPASAAGVLGVLYGYDALDEEWIGGIPAMEDEKFLFTDYSLNEFIDSTQKRAIEAVRRAGGEVDGESIRIPKQAPIPPKLEQWSMGIPTASLDIDDPAWTWRGAWEVHEQTAWWDPKARFSVRGGNEATVRFTGSAVAISGQHSPDGGKADIYFDGEKVSEINAYIGENTKERDLWHRYGLENGPHTLRIVTTDKPDPRSTGNLFSIVKVIAFNSE